MGEQTIGRHGDRGVAKPALVPNAIGDTNRFAGRSERVIIERLCEQRARAHEPQEARRVHRQ
jgi:hypothetical protein